MIKLNKRGDAGDWPDFVGFFLILVLLGGGIVGAYFAFFSSDYDIREEEARLINNQLRECVLREGNDVMDEEFSFSECGFSEKFFDNNVLVYIKRESDGKERFEGVLDFVNQCKLIDNQNKFAKCWESKIEVSGENYVLIGGSNQKARAVIVQ